MEFPTEKVLEEKGLLKAGLSIRKELIKYFPNPRLISSYEEMQKVQVAYRDPKMEFKKALLIKGPQNDESIICVFLTNLIKNIICTQSLMSQTLNKFQ
jgi:hypothetical protein